ncbi:MAG: carbohydrate kinase family protein [Anaerolineales bacterium]|nr:carbohydrate kinase family protein [Anaerolineales bacterium]
MKQVLILGGVSYNTMIYTDEFPAPRSQTVYPRRFFETVGSTGAGKALNLCRLDFGVTLYGLLGEDEFAPRVIRPLTAAGIRFIHGLDPGGTKRHVNLMDAGGGRISIFIVPGTYEVAVDWSILEPEIARCDFVALNILNFCRSAIPLLQQQGKEIWVDLHDYDGRNPHHHDFIAAADVLLFSSDQMPNYRPFMVDCLAQGKQLVICTHGRHGATTLTAAGEWLETPIIDAYQRHDTNGAGDAFFSGVLYGRAQGYGVARCLRLGAIVSGLCITSSELAYEGLSADLVEREYNRYFAA